MAEWIHRKYPSRQIARLEIECSFPHRTHDYSFDVWERRDHKLVLLGYLVHDDDASNPLDNCDAMGKIICKEQDRNFLSHVGVNCDGDPILEEQAAILARLKGEELDGFVCETDVLVKMWEEARKQGKVGTPYAVALSYFDHEGYVESESRGHRWKPDAVWIPDDELLKHINTFAPEKRAAEARATFEIAIEEYNKWAMGDCWGVVVDVFERQDGGSYKLKENDACWGYVGDDYALQELKETLGWHRDHLSRKPASRQEKILSEASQKLL